jgi:mannose-6-phosphate isomerase
MPALYPLLMAPEFKPRVWGTRSLAPIYPQEFSEPVGEAWLTADECKVSNGPLAGKTLGQLCKEFGADLIGESTPIQDRFPLLIKFLFPHEKLSVQVHPNDAMARRLGQPSGKTECWYVLAVEPGAQVGLGLRPGVSKKDFEQAIKNGDAEKSLNWIDIYPGELIYVPAGTVHAIGPGSILVETQQNSDTTFRLYDYGRPRELHLEQGLTATREKTNAGKVEPRTSDAATNLVSADCFLVDRLQPSSAIEFQHGGSASCDVFIAVDGCGVVETEGGSKVTFARGEAVVVPAAIERFSVCPQWTLECLRVRLPE